MSDSLTPRYLNPLTPPHISTLVLMAGLSAMTMNIYLPSLPGMAVYFDTEYATMQLSVSLYLVATALIQIIIGPISDRYGRRKVVIGGVATFLLMTVGCIYSTTPEMFLLFRMGQAMIATGMVLSRAIVRDMYGPAKSASMIGYVTMGMSIVPMVSPMLGGFLEEHFDWRASFWMMGACGLALLFIVWRDLGETSTGRPTTMKAQFAEYPELLTAPRFWAYAATAAFVSGAFFAFLGGAPFVGTQVYGLSPSQLGLYFGLPAIGYALGNFLSGRYSVRMGLNPMILIGSSLSTCGMIISPLLYWAGWQDPVTFFGLMIFVGLGNGMVLPNATAGMLSVRPRLAGTASGLGGALMIGGGAALSALAAAVLKPGLGPYPLQVIMLISSSLGIVSVLYVIRRERRLASMKPKSP